jgi:hypothetical protein
MNIIRTGLVIVLFCTFVRAEDTIQGMYSYTYGDSESLVEARQTCKDLALRDAIESYYLFIESSTSVENAQVKEDIIRSISAGYLSNIQIVEQTEEGRTITMSVTATVNGDEIQAMIAERAEDSKLSDSEPEEKETQDDAVFFDEMDQFENQAQAASASSDKQDVHSLLNRRQQLMADLDRHKPLSTNLFQFTAYQCIRGRMQVQDAMSKLRYYRLKRNVQQAKNQSKTVQDLSRILQKETDALQSFKTLSEPNMKIRDTWVKRCRETLSQARQILTPLKRQ